MSRNSRWSRSLLAVLAFVAAGAAQAALSPDGTEPGGRNPAGRNPAGDAANLDLSCRIDGSQAVIGLLLPAVQKMRDAAARKVAPRRMVSVEFKLQDAAGRPLPAQRVQRKFDLDELGRQVKMPAPGGARTCTATMVAL
jgi:hypothetical protein